MAPKSKAFLWSKQQVHDLITIYQANESLWNCSLWSYKDKQLRDELITKISIAVDAPKEQCINKIHNLRNQYIYEVKKMRKRNSFTDRVEQYVSRWEFYERLQFLRKFITTRKAFNKKDESDQDTTTEENFSTEEQSMENTRTNDLLLSVKADSPKNIEQEASKNISVNLNAVGKDTNHNNGFYPKRKVHKSKDTEDDCEIFGKFVTSELKTLSDDLSRRKLKRKIMEAILEVGNEDDFSTAEKRN